eukprot:2781949-Amphidinium_carterae.2
MTKYDREAKPSSVLATVRSAQSSSVLGHTTIRANNMPAQPVALLGNAADAELSCDIHTGRDCASSQHGMTQLIHAFVSGGHGQTADWASVRI